MSERAWSGLVKSGKHLCPTDMRAFTFMQGVGVLELQAACIVVYGSGLIVERGNAGADDRLVPAFPELSPLADPVTLHSVMGPVVFPASFPNATRGGRASSAFGVFMTSPHADAVNPLVL